MCYSQNENKYYVKLYNFLIQNAAEISVWKEGFEEMY
jgi:hypothetical protein